MYIVYFYSWAFDEWVIRENTRASTCFFNPRGFFSVNESILLVPGTANE